MSGGLITITDLARRLGRSRNTVAEAVRRLGIEPKDIPYSPQGKGLNESDVQRLEEDLRRDPAPATST